MVTSGHYLASKIGVDVVARGGNATDAGVAAAFVLTLVKPQECGIGGECPILVYQPGRSGRPNPFVISGQGRAPRSMTIQRVRELGLDDVPGKGPIAAAVSATVGALITALQQAGTLGLEETLGPVVELARDGYAMYQSLHDSLVRHVERIREWPSSAEVFLPDGVPEVGQIVRFPVWANAMQHLLDAEARHRSSGRVEALQAASDEFYKGRIAQEIERFVAPSRSNPKNSPAGDNLPAFLEPADFAAHRSTVETPVSYRYKGLDVFKTPPWGQGPVFLQQLALLAGYDVASLLHNTPAYIHLVTEAAKLAFADREAFYGDPDFVDVPIGRLLSDEYNRERRALIDLERASAELRPGPRAPAGIRPSRNGTKESGDTTHVDVIDAEGNLFTATPSGGWLQSSPVVPGLGFPLGTRLQQFNLVEGHPNALAPGKRPRTTLSPTLVMRNGEPHMVFGTEGGDNQDQWTLQFFLNVVEFGMDLQEAIDAPLFNTAHMPDSFHPHDHHPASLLVEGRIPQETRDALAAMGHDMYVLGDWDSGQVTAARITPKTGLLEAGASPR
ncbi:MAG TPA: gamma-glutamyltransferase family protein, partial [Candidatus Limnocylindrales bacterium]|nr:gamma-glutamyltransferase family protein [Candidatus Limnocylindrales bacterium]